MANNLTFDKLTFIKHRSANGGKQSRIDFVNGHWVSIVGGAFGLYGNGVDTFELFTSEHDDIEAWAKIGRINEVLQDMQEKHGVIKAINFKNI